MKNRFLCLVLSLLMLLAAIPTARAAAFTDTQGHWAEEYINRVVELELFNGMSESSFLPGGTMTRGMFVTVLGRLEGIEPELWTEVPQIFKDVAPGEYYTPYVNWAACCGIVSGMSEDEFWPNAPINREQMAKLVAFYVEQMGYSLKESEDDIPDEFSDGDKISAWAQGSVEFLRTKGILNGSPDGEDGVAFLPSNTSTRAECAAVFCRLYDGLLRDDSLLPAGISLSDSEVRLVEGQSYSLSVSFTPVDAIPVPLFWSSSNEESFTVSAEGTVHCLGLGSATVTARSSNGLLASCEFLCTEDLASAEESYADKCLRLFGEVVSDPRLYYAIKDEDGNLVMGSNGYPLMDYATAEADMVSITVQVWDFNSAGDKITRSKTIQVHKNLAATYKQIFKEIYEGEEMFPIHYLGGFSHGGKSEHTIGTAVDINPDENYYYNPNTGQQVGDYWKPGEDPYSIPLDGDVVRIFAKYGFTQGIYWNSGAKDYMHFSYFGT